MRFFSTIVASTLFAFSAHAAISNDVASCISKVNAVNQQYDITSKMNLALSGPLIVIGQGPLPPLIHLITDAVITCSIITQPIDVESADALLISYGKLPPAVDRFNTAFNSVPSLKPLAYPPIRGPTIQLAESIERALLSSSSDHLTTTAGYIASIKKSFEFTN